ncbi:hypothetical protein GH733_000618, partial [Mirounga leonina]
MRTRDAPQSSHSVADSGAPKTKRGAGRARRARGRAHASESGRRRRARPTSPGTQNAPQPPFLCCGDLRNPKPREPPAPGTRGCSPRGSLRLFSRGGPAGRPRSPPCLRPPGATGSPLTPHPVRRAAHRRRRSGHGQSDGGQARTGAAASGAAPTHAAVVTLSSNSSSQSTSTAPNPANTTTTPSGGALQSSASLFVISFSLLHLY